METGTLDELNLQPEDVVKCVKDYGMGNYIAGKLYTVNSDGRVRNEKGSLLHGSCSTFRIISRASGNAPDLTAITTPFGLLDKATQEALRAHGGPYEWYSGGRWKSVAMIVDGAFVTRVKPAPKVETVTLNRTMDDLGCISLVSGTTPVRVTFTRTNGVIDLDSYKVEAR